MILADIMKLVNQDIRGVKLILCDPILKEICMAIDPTRDLSQYADAKTAIIETMKSSRNISPNEWFKIEDKITELVNSCDTDGIRCDDNKFWPTIEKCSRKKITMKDFFYQKPIDDWILFDASIMKIEVLPGDGTSEELTLSKIEKIFSDNKFILHLDDKLWETLIRECYPGNYDEDFKDIGSMEDKVVKFGIDYLKFAEARIRDKYKKGLDWNDATFIALPKISHSKWNKNDWFDTNCKLTSLEKGPNRWLANFETK